MDYDVIIIGSGPAGGMAAIHCAQAGLRTALFEKESLPRRKVCAGGIVKRAINLLPPDLDYPVESICDKVELRVPDLGYTFQDSRDRLVTMVSRVDFDYALVKHAIKKGACVFDGIEIKQVRPHQDYVEVTAGSDCLTASYVILAEGASARIANQFWKDDRLMIPALESEIMLSPEEMKVFEGVARFDFDMMNAGYAWVFPKKDHISVGLGGLIAKGSKQSLTKMFDEYKQKIGLPEGCVERNRRGFVIPVRPRKQRYMKNRMLLVGDTAGFADPITAEGFTYALKSGIEAAKAIASYKDPEAVSRGYHDGIEVMITKELKVGAKISSLFFVSKWFRNFILRRFGHRFSVAMVNVIEGRQTYFKALSRRPLLKFLFLCSIT